MKIAMTRIYVNNPLEAFSFYTKYLGFKEFMLSEEHSLVIVVPTNEPEGTVLLLEPNNDPIALEYQIGLYKAHKPLIVLSTEDLKVKYLSLSKQNIRFHQKPTKTDWGMESLFDDNQGNWILLIQNNM